MRDLQNLVELGREFAKPWKRATQLLSVLLALSLIGLFLLAYRNNNIVLQADLNSDSEITQTQG